MWTDVRSRDVGDEASFWTDASWTEFVVHCAIPGHGCLQEWEDDNNFHRPRGGLGGQTPYERLRQKTKCPAVTGQRQLHTTARTAISVQ